MPSWSHAGTREVRILRAAITLDALEVMAAATFGNLVKAVVDVERGVMAVDAEMHADEEATLLDDGSSQPALWGVNLYPASYGTDDFLEFDSVINIRPSQGNRSRTVEDPAIRTQVATVVDRLVTG